MSKQVKYGPLFKDGRRAVHWCVGPDKWKHVGWLMSGVSYAQAKARVDKILGEYTGAQ